MEFMIRRAEHSDVEELVELRMALLQEVGGLTNKTEIETVSHANKMYYEKHLKSEEYISFVAESQGKLIATSGLIIINRPPYLHNLLGMDAYIMNVYTIPTYRGNGIATALLDSCIEFAKNNHVGRIILTASADGLPVYEKRGFKRKSSAMELVLNG
ncbi:GNAT family N-acetyltransferase [Paenibacillus soyae]|uniref:GNAT family N-acetyltransferase n=1 Tax=Paenibacillus soyae TaxID=2969249 RepID=A0A9X2SBZ0_9BACL|nr:GNAT family N-acetyltransferase [Paenibacillus soyae]MCR2805462.1 GNAT family N-acetyltransferase [Paenibacillus soyae]